MHALLPPPFNHAVEQGIHLGVLYCSSYFLAYNAFLPSLLSQLRAYSYFRIPEGLHLPNGSLTEKTLGT